VQSHITFRNNSRGQLNNRTYIKLNNNKNNSCTSRSKTAVFMVIKSYAVITVTHADAVGYRWGTFSPPLTFPAPLAHLLCLHGVCERGYSHVMQVLKLLVDSVLLFMPTLHDILHRSSCWFDLQIAFDSPVCACCTLCMCVCVCVCVCVSEKNVSLFTASAAGCSAELTSTVSCSRLKKKPVVNDAFVLISSAVAPKSR
jgi:hypothetical protein